MDGWRNIAVTLIDLRQRLCWLVVQFGWAAAITNQMNIIIASVLSSSLDKSVPPMPKPDTLKGIDDLIHAGFEAYRSSCFNWLLAATGLVVFGLVLEGPELWHEITSIVGYWRFTHRFHFSLPESHVPNWAKLAGFVGWLFIVAGVAGEYVADSFVSKADGYVQTFDEILLTETQKGTAVARERASAAYARASENERETASTLKQAALERADAAKSLVAAETARKEVEGFSFQIAQANERAAKSNEIAEQERLARIQLEARLAPRFLTAAQRQDFTASLKNLGLHDLDVLILGDTPEIKRIADLLVTTIQNAGWKVRSWGVVGGASVTGILIVPLENTGNENLAGTLARALDTEGIAASAYPPVGTDKWDAKYIGGMLNGPNWDTNKMAPIRMYIGAKP